MINVDLLELLSTVVDFKGNCQRYTEPDSSFCIHNRRSPSWDMSRCRSCFIGKMLVPNKYPLYKVSMGLIIKGTIPRVPPFFLWLLDKFNNLISTNHWQSNYIAECRYMMRLCDMTFFHVFAGVFSLSIYDGNQLLPIPSKSGSCLATPEGLLINLIFRLLVSEGIFHCIMYVPSPDTLKGTVRT